MRFFKYLSYVVRHKWFVLQECWRVGLYWRGLVHDLTKLMPRAEFLPYMRFFYGPKGEPKQRRDKTGYYKPVDTGDDAFDKAWLHHQKWNDHHWQWWVLPFDDGGWKVFEMSPAARLEMVCDWVGAGKAQGTKSDNGEPEVVNWYAKNRHKMMLGPETRNWVEDYIGYKRPFLVNVEKETVLDAPWPPEGAPEGFGMTTKAVPRPGSPDIELARDVQSLLWGRLNLAKRAMSAELHITYEDGERQVTARYEGPLRLAVERVGRYQTHYLEPVGSLVADESEK